MAADVFEALSEAFRLRRALEELALDRRNLIGALHAREWDKADGLEKAVRDVTTKFEEAEREVVRMFDGDDAELATEAGPWWQQKPEHAPGRVALTGELDVDVEDAADGS